MSIKEGVPSKIKFNDFNLYDDILNINNKVYSPLNFKQLNVGNKLVELNPQPIQKSPFEFTKRKHITVYDKMGEAFVRAQNMDVYQKKISDNINEDFIQRKVNESLSQGTQTTPNEDITIQTQMLTNQFTGMTADNTREAPNFSTPNSPEPDSPNSPIRNFSQLRRRRNSNLRGSMERRGLDHQFLLGNEMRQQLLNNDIRPPEYNQPIFDN